MHHVEKLNRRSLENVLEGKKRIEIVFQKEKTPPFNCIAEEDEIFFQSKDGYAVAKADITKVEEFTDLGQDEVKEMLEKYKAEMMPTEANLERDIYSKFATVFWFENVREIRPFFVNTQQGNMRGWLQTKDIIQYMKSGR